VIAGRPLLALAAILALAGCDEAGEAPASLPAASPAPVSTEASSPAMSADAPAPLQAEDVPQLASKSCADVVQFALESIGGHDFARAALAWNSAAGVDAAALDRRFGAIATPQFTWDEPVVEGGAGSLYCTVSVTLVDAGNARLPPEQGTIDLRRVNDVDGATAEQLRWTIRSSSFVPAAQSAG
jgi:hypothetical protein